MKLFSGILFRIKYRSIDITYKITENISKSTIDFLKKSDILTYSTINTYQEYFGRYLNCSFCSLNSKGDVFMNKQESDILKELYFEPFVSQRVLAENTGHSLGIVNRSVLSLVEKGYLDFNMNITSKAKKEFAENKPKRAIILAAGFGMRMVPINTETPKALLMVHGECLIERQIKQLHKVGITEIYVVVGFLKEQFEYLIDNYGVKLIVNTDYATKGNIYSLKLASEYMDNSYIIPSDIWCDRNPFNLYELYSWYMVTDLIDDDSEVRVNRKSELVRVPKNASGNTMIGISYLLHSDAQKIRRKINLLCQEKEKLDCFWEEALYENDKMLIPARIMESTDVVEINTYEQLREIDDNSEHLKSDAISTISEALGIDARDITDITILKKGMTNRSFLFSCKGSKYIMRIPGEGTDKLINRREETDVYKAISGKGLCDDPIYINPNNGYKITRFINNVHCCDPTSEGDLKVCMDKLKQFHSMKLKVNHEFDIYERIDFYESLWEGKKSVYRDYEATKANVFSLKRYIDENAEEKILTHIDAVPDNFLFGNDDKGNSTLQLTDWEYAGMQDPHVDIAMFCIYSLYNKKEVDRLIDIYFCNKCIDKVRAKIYCYIACCGLLWSNWCEYKRNLGVEFGEYSLRQYRYAKDYYKYAVALINKNDN